MLRSISIWLVHALFYISLRLSLLVFVLALLFARAALDDWTLGSVSFRRIFLALSN